MVTEPLCFFIVQRDDAYVFRPNDDVDPKFSKALRETSKSGVEIYAYSASFIGNKITLGGKVQIML